MRKTLMLLFTAVITTTICFAQGAQSQAGASGSGQAAAAAGQSGAQATGNASAAASQANTVSRGNQETAGTSQLQAGSTVQAQLAKSVDARKNKTGDEVIAKTTSDMKSAGHVVVPRGSKLVGHVTEVKEHSKQEANSTLGIAFDHAILKNGTTVPMMLTIRAIGRAEASAASFQDESMASGSGGGTTSSAPRSGGGLLGGVRSTAGGAVDTADRAAGAAVNTAGTATGNVSGGLSASSQGVVGIPGLTLSQQTSSSTNASVISSQGANVHLDSGTQMVLQVSQ